MIYKNVARTSRYVKKVNNSVIQISITILRVYYAVSMINRLVRMLYTGWGRNSGRSLIRATTYKNVHVIKIILKTF